MKRQTASAAGRLAMDLQRHWKKNGRLQSRMNGGAASTSGAREKTGKRW